LLFETGREIRHSAPTTSTLQEQTRYSANLAGLFLPGEHEQVYRGLGRFSEKLIGEHGVSGKEIFPGCILLASGLLGIFLGRKNIKHYGFWLLSLVVFFVISLGPYLNAGGRTFFSAPLPYYYLRKIFFFFEMDRSPVRIIVLALLALTIFSAGFFKRVGQIFTGGETAVIFNLLALLAVIDLFQAPMQISRVELPAPYQQIASERGQFSILELPLLPDIYRYSGFFQPYHKKALAANLIGRKIGVGYGDDPLFFYFDEPLRFLNLDPESRDKALEQIKAELKRRQIRYIIVYLKFVDNEQNSDIDRLATFLDPQKKIESYKMFRMYQFDYGDAR
jgi:hypothetical protein